MTLSSRTFKKLQRITGKKHCTRDKEDLACYAYDAITRNHFPDAVVFPADTGEVSEILRLACSESFCVVPRGSGSGTTGGSLAVQGGVVMVMSRLNSVIEIDHDNFIARVQPGVITGAFHRRVEHMGLFYPPDPSSSDFSTIGGNVAECAGGPRAVKYGVTRDYVLGLEAVLPTGDIIKTGVRTAKGVVGYDLTRLLTGSEGTLAVITELTLKLLPLPESVCTMTAVFSTMESAAITVSEIIRSGIVPRTVEFLDNASIVCAESYSKMGLPVDAGAILIIETDGRKEEAEYSINRLTEICRENGATGIQTAATALEKQQLWNTRKAVSPALYMYGPDKINEDIVVPRSKIPDMVRYIEQLRMETGLTMVSFGHAGDGNIHFNIMLDKRDAEQYRLAEKAVDAVFDYAIKLGGTLSGEHGVGITKSKYITKELGTSEIELMKTLKRSFDPRNILNPGKIF